MSESKPDPIGFTRQIAEHWLERGYGLDDEAIYGLLISHGILHETTATAEDAETQWAADWDIHEGDPCTKPAPAWTEMRKARHSDGKLDCRGRERKTTSLSNTLNDK